jgi:hypothetical protein
VIFIWFHRGFYSLPRLVIENGGSPWLTKLINLKTGEFLWKHVETIPESGLKQRCLVQHQGLSTCGYRTWDWMWMCNVVYLVCPINRNPKW